MKKSPRARLVKTKHGKKPSGPGWFVVNAAESVWVGNDKFGAATLFEDPANRFEQLGINIHVLQPGQPACHYHAETEQEDFLVLSGECTLLVDGKTLALSQWDLFHCPPGTNHVFVGAGDGPCAILMTGVRSKRGKVHYPRSRVALAHDAGVKKATSNPRESYADVPPWSRLEESPWPLSKKPSRRRRRSS